MLFTPADMGQTHKVKDSGRGLSVTVESVQTTWEGKVKQNDTISYIRCIASSVFAAWIYSYEDRVKKNIRSAKTELQNKIFIIVFTAIETVVEDLQSCDITAINF